MKNFKLLAVLTVAVITAGLLTSCACHKTAKKGKDTCTECTAMAATNAPAVAPAPMAASPTKEQRLAVLLSQYETNAISPAAYHTQRAEIIAEP